MQLTRKSSLTGLEHTMDLPITEEQLADFNRGTMVQDAFPHLSADQREFILSGITAEEWAAAFPPEEEDDDPEAA